MRTYEQCILTAAKDTETDSTQVYTHTLIIVVPHLSVGAVPQQLCTPEGIVQPTLSSVTWGSIADMSTEGQGAPRLHYLILLKIESRSFFMAARVRVLCRNSPARF